MKETEAKLAEMTAENETLQTHKKRYIMENEKLMREQEEHKSQSMPFTNCA